MVKKVLADAGLYQLSDLDKDFRAGFEEFIAHDILARDDHGGLFWNAVEGKLRSRELGRVVFGAASKAGDVEGGCEPE